MTRFVLGTRASALALAQVELTRAALALAWPGLEVVVEKFVTRGDRNLELSLVRAAEAGGKGLFTKELEDALLAGTIDAAVHSLKDLPGHNPPGLLLTAVLERAPSADVLITRDACTLADLAPGAVLGTSSVRRARQLRWRRPDLEIVEWRGNVPTRLRKLGENAAVTGIVLAEAGLVRLGYDLRAGVLDFAPWKFAVYSLAAELLPAIGQGAIAVQSRADRPEVSEVLAAIDHPATHVAIRAERELQRRLAGDCALPVGIRTEQRGGRLRLEAILFDPAEEKPPALATAEGDSIDPEAVAAELFARLCPDRL